MSRSSVPASVPQDVAREAVEAAVRAPSVHNTQPWRFRIGSDAVDVYADDERNLRVLDPSGRQLRISCGAAVEFLRTALRARGWDAEPTLLPDTGPEDRIDVPSATHLARLSIRQGDGASADDLALAAAIGHRSTQRTPFAPRAVPPASIAALRRAAESEGAWLHVLRRREDQLALVSLLARADAMELADERYRDELRAWVRTDASGDGVPAAALPPPGERHSDVVLRDFAPDDDAGAADAPEQPPARPVDEHPLVVVLGTDGDDARDHVIAGMALGRLLLRGTVDDLAASPLGQVLDWPGPRAQLRQLLGLQGLPQMVLRVGYADPAGATGATVSARRSLEEVLIP